MKLTDRETKYAQYILDNLGTDEKPATIEANEITFAEPDGQSEFLELVQDEASYDRACGARTVGARLAHKIAEEAGWRVR